jgi:hypothetical protein
MLIHTYLPGPNLNMLVKIRLILPGIELQSLSSVLLLSWLPLFLKKKGGRGIDVFSKATLLRAGRSGRQWQKTNVFHNASRPVVGPS